MPSRPLSRALEPGARRLLRGPALLGLALGFVLVGGGGCALEQRMAVEVIDAPLRERGQELRAPRGPRGSRGLPGYPITAIEGQHSRDGEPLLAAADQPRGSTFYALRFVLTPGPTEATEATGGRWRVACTAERRIAQNIDFAATAGERRDAVALACTIDDPKDRRWTLGASGDLGRGLTGDLVAAPASGLTDAPWTLEIITRRHFFRAVARELPFPVAQLRRGPRVVAALLLDSPERAWLAPELDAAERALAIAALFALRLLPLAEPVP